MSDGKPEALRCVLRHSRISLALKLLLTQVVLTSSLWTSLKTFARILLSGESNVSGSITYQTPPYGAAFAPGAISPLVEAAET
jgi:hypothetical protein